MPVTNRGFAAERRPSSSTVTSITRYPVKSCRGESLSSAVVEPWGLAGDRRWMLVDEAGMALTAREIPRLVLVMPHVTGAGLLLTAPGHPPLAVATPDTSTLVEVTVWRDTLPGALAAEEASGWFSEVTGRSVRLVFLDDPRRRPTDRRHSREGDVVSFADGYPVLLASEDSLAELNAWVATGARAAEGPLPMSRFRPNVVVAGSLAWAEDGWRRVRIGETTFRSAKACDRCVLTLIDPETAERTKEPLYSLARHRQWDHKTWFAVNLLPENFGHPLRLGQEVEVLDQTDEPGPQR